MLDSLRARRAKEDGFTLIELMVVVLIIAILVAIAIPTFLGARGKANDRAAQADIRNAFTAERTYYVDSQAYGDKDQITAIENSLKYTDTAGVATALASTNTVMVVVSDGAQPAGKVTLATFSSSGHCFWLQDEAASGTKYGVTGKCTDDPSATYKDTTDGWKY
jgi:type IV pilus assembly protein PilA